MKKKKILVVEDSAFFRKLIIEVIKEDERFEVVGYARNGIEAMEQLRKLEVDAITLDIEMPQMNGIDFLDKIMIEKPRPTMILSANVEEESKTREECLRKGAKDCFYKDEMLNSDKIREEFLDRLEKVANSKAERRKEIVQEEEKNEYKILMIGSSTGGPKALNKIIEYIDEDFPIPVVIVQHMPNGFTKSLAEKLDLICKIPVKEVERGDKLENGKIYIAPAGYQTKIEERVDGLYLNVSKDYSDSLYKPSVDTTILSATKYFGEDMMVVILTGMGEDGKEACKVAKNKGSYIIAETEETAVVYGMPKAVIDAGLANKKLPIHKIYSEIRRKLYK